MTATASPDLTDRCAIVTGAGSGIGRATAIAFAGAGASVVALDVTAEGVEATVAEIAGSGGSAVAVLANIGDETQVEAALRQAEEAFGPVTVLVNNAGIMDDMAPPERVSLEMWERVIRVNLTGAFLMSRAVLPGMLEQGRGAIVNVSSEAGARGGCAGISYTASKHGVIGLTRSLAYHYGDRGIRTNAILPGAVATNIGGPDAYDPEGMEKLGPVMAVGGAVSAGRIAAPEDMASIMLFLASDAAGFVNGALVPADSGWLAA